MFRSILILLALVGTVSALEGPTCDVGEQTIVKGSGLCNDKEDGEGKCKDYCAHKYGAELLGSTCSAPREGTQKRECICKLKCCNSGCWGDPHCWTCDGVKFGYQGLKKHFMLKPVTEYATLPYFEIRQVNKVWQKGPMAILDISEVIIRDWSKIIEVKAPDSDKTEYQITVNGKAEKIPYRYTELDDYREIFLDIQYVDPNTKKQLVIKTSFGLRVTYSTVVNPTPGFTYADISIDIPRHPELKGNSHGLLGKWNDNPEDDSIDANGQKQPLDDKFSWAFGDSWIVPGGGNPTARCVMEEAHKKHEERMETLDPVVKGKVSKLCQQNLENPKLLECAKKLGRPPPSVDDCFMDLVYIEDECGRKKYLGGLIKNFAVACDDKEIYLVEPDCQVQNLVPLYRLYKPQTDNHFYTTNYDEALNAMTKLGYNNEGTPGLVAVNGKDCNCNENGLKPVHRSYHAGGGKEDHFYTQSEPEAANAAAKLGYTREGVAYYCPTTPQCGATLAFRRYWRGTDHFYTPSLEEAQKNVFPYGGKDEGILCYIWPAPGPVRQLQ